ncbi:MAG: hypothetical protein ACK4RK_13010 [Gemmataceae bacterium]
MYRIQALLAAGLCLPSLLLLAPSVAAQDEKASVVLIMSSKLKPYADHMPSHIPLIRGDARGKLCSAQVIFAPAPQTVKLDNAVRFFFILELPKARAPQAPLAGADVIAGRAQIVTAYSLYYRGEGRKPELLAKSEVWSTTFGSPLIDPLVDHFKTLGNLLSQDLCQALAAKIIDEKPKKIPKPQVVQGAYDSVAYYTERKDENGQAHFTVKLTNQLPVQVVVNEMILVNSVTGQSLYTATFRGDNLIRMEPGARHLAIISSGNIQQFALEEQWVRFKDMFLVVPE